MSIKYETTILEGDFEGAEHDVKLSFEDNNIEIKSGYYPDHYATLTLKQFERVAIEVERFKKMLEIERVNDEAF